MEKNLIARSLRPALAVAGLSLILASSAMADCGISTGGSSILARSAVAVFPDALSTRNEVSTQTPAVMPARDEHQAPPSIVGLWKSTFTSGGQVVDQGFDQWNGDGTEILNDDPPPATGNVCLGVWVPAGSSTYKLKHPSWTFDAAGNVNGTAVIREQVTVSPDGNSYQGTYTININDLSGNHLAHFAGTISATRVTVDF